MRHILLVATALTALAGAACAEAHQASGTGASSQSAATAAASAMSAAKSAAIGNTGNSTTVNVSTTGSSGNGSANTTDPNSYQYLGYGGGYTVRNTPEVIPPNVVGGNPCAIGASGGLSMAGFGIAAGATWADKQCERRQQAALLFNIGKAKAATELMCQDESVRAALRTAGEPCVADQVAVVAAAPVAIAAPPPSPQAVVPVAATAVPAAECHLRVPATAAKQSPPPATERINLRGTSPL